MSKKLTNNTLLSRYEIEIEGQIVFSDYEREGSTVSLTHVETPVALRGKGAAAVLMQEIAALARTEELKIEPICSYAAVWFLRHPEFGDLMAG